MKVRYLIITLSVFLFFFKGYAQNTVNIDSSKADSLLLLIEKHSTDDKERVRLLNEYARQCFYIKEIKKGFIATKEAREISKKLNFEGGKIMYYLTFSAFHSTGDDNLQIYYQKQAQWLSNSIGDRLINYYVELEIPDVDFGNNYKEILDEFTSILENFKSEDDKEIQASLLTFIRYCNIMLNNNDEALNTNNRIIELFTDLNQIYPVFLYSGYKMNLLKRLGKGDEAKKIETDLIGLFIKNENENAIGLISNALASGYAENGRYLLSIEYYMKSIEVFEEIGDHDMLAKTWFDLAIAYENLNLNNKAYECYTKCITELEINKNTDNLNLVYGALVFPTIAIEKYDEAKKYMSLALRDTVNSDKYYLRARFNDANGQIRKKQGKYDEAIPFFKKALDEFAQAKGYTWAAPFEPLYLTECYYKIGDYSRALEYGLKCLELEESLKLNQTLTKKRASLWLSKIYQELGNTTMAYTYLKMHQEITEESEKLDELNRIADGEVKAILDKSKKEIDKLEQERLQSVQQNRIQKLWIFSIIGALISAIILSLVLYRNNKNKQKANALLQAQKEEIQTTLEQLEATQSQLIQAEKMASLGELTAGIAHEIQNPLNFVNNFADVNTELIVEMQDELKAGDIEEAILISNDLKENELKIIHHGKRAESIVRGMLQHSRKSSGQKEPCDINALADEYLRLSYHGLRAKDKSFNADFKLELDEALPEINVVPQDIGRVLLNLINNAFYAVDKRAKELTPLNPPERGTKNDQNNYKPIVTVSTSYSLSFREGRGEVRLSVKDNGDGIPENIKDKIFQPFFTTKPTGSGTGLGLSLSYDIIKAHGGELKVETKEGEGTKFTIVLPKYELL